MSTHIFRLINEAEAELCRGVRASYWQPVVDAARAENERNEAAFDDQTRELENDVTLLEELGQEHALEFRRRT